MFAQPVYTMVQSGATLSDPIALRWTRSIGLHVPTLTAAESGAAITVRAAAAQSEVSSANFFPVELTPPNSGPMQFVCGVAGKAYPLGQIGEALAAVQFAFDVPVTQPRTLTIVTKA